jgi:hypothetical protein
VGSTKTDGRIIAGMLRKLCDVLYIKWRYSLSLAFLVLLIAGLLLALHTLKFYVYIIPASAFVLYFVGMGVYDYIRKGKR